MDSIHRLKVRGRNKVQATKRSPLSKRLSLAQTHAGGRLYPHRKDISVILLLLFTGTLFSDSARCQTESFDALSFLPSLSSLVKDTHQIPAGGGFDISTLPPGVFETKRKGRRRG
jgi:hypothetical protein